MRAVGRISYGLVAPRGWCELEEGNGGEAIWGADAETQKWEPEECIADGEQKLSSFPGGTQAPVF